MQTGITERIDLNGLTIRQRMPPGDGPHPIILMLHGWTGDENSMWIFAPRLPAQALLLAPRGLFTVPIGGYGWHPHSAKSWPWIEDFQPAIDILLSRLTPKFYPTADFTEIRLLGFSQGAALSFSIALYHPNIVRAIAGLSGFLPVGASHLIQEQPLKNKPVFLAHGTEDTLVPVDKARQAVKLLEIAGCKVTYCEDTVGHKLSVSCFRGMQSFFE